MDHPNSTTTSRNRLPNPAYGLALVFVLVLIGFGLTALLSGDESPATAATSETAEPEVVAESQPVDVEPVEPTVEEPIVDSPEPAEGVDQQATACIFDDGGGTTTTSWTNTEGSATSDAAVVTRIDTYRFGSCIRTIIELSSNFPLFDETPVGVTLLPNDITIDADSGGGIPSISFGKSIDQASTVDDRFRAAEITHSTFVYRTKAGNLAGEIYGPSSMLDVKFDNSNGTIIIDVAETVDGGVGRQPLLDENGVIIKSVESSADNSVTITGYARPFEANLEAEVLVDGTPTNVGWAQENGEVASSKGISTTDWISALGYFEFTIELDAGIELSDVVVRLNPEGGSDTPTEVDLVLDDLLN